MKVLIVISIFILFMVMNNAKDLKKVKLKEWGKSAKSAIFR